MLTKKKPVLTDILAVLVREWGYDEVSRHLHQLSDAQGLSNDTAHIRLSLNENFRGKNERRKSTAVDYVAKIDLPVRKKETLLQIAAQFEEKRFLPSVGDIENFLSLRSEQAHHFRDRRDGFRRVIDVISRFSDEALEKLARGNTHSGPSQLGPLSDAIRTASAVIRADEAGHDQIAKSDTPTGASKV